MSLELIQIHIRTWKCWPAVSCTCAVVVREDNVVLGINSCGMDGAVLPIEYLSAQDSGATIQISNDGYSYTVSGNAFLHARLHVYCK